MNVRRGEARKGAGSGRYPPNIREEELKNKVAAEWFPNFDTTQIVGNVDFCVAVPATDLPLCDAESVLWAEAKRGTEASLDFALVQLILTIGKERTFDRHLPPKYLAAFNAARIAFIPYSEVVEIFYQNDFNWNVAPSDHETREFGDLYQRVIRILESATLEFDFVKDEPELRRFIKTNLHIGGTGGSLVQITKNNFTHIYQRWRETVMPTILVPDWTVAKKNGIIDADFFLADIFSSDNAAITDKLNVLLMNDHYRQSCGKNSLGFQLFSEISFSDGQKAHRIFWNRYKRPPRREYWNYIVNRRDLLVPQDVRERKGSFFTPQKWVSLSQDYLATVLGENWQDDHYVWDCCAGTGNLEVGLTNKYNVWVSTLDQQDVDVIRQRIKFGANLLDSHVFRFDFLNDHFDKLPQGLKAIIDDPEKRKHLIIYINPPYAEAGDIRQRSGTGKNKTDVSVVHATYNRYLEKIGIAGRELFAQFFMHIHDEIPGCVLAEFSKLKHLQSPNFKAFRQAFHGTLEKCFIVPADTFDNVKGDFPIGFFVWRLGVEEMPAAPKHGGNGGAKTRRPCGSFACAPSNGISSASCESGDDGLREATPQKQTPCLGDASKSPCLSAAGHNGVFTSAVADVYDRKGEFIGTQTILSYDNERSINDWLIETRKRPSRLNLGFLSARSHDVQHILDIYFKSDKALIKSARGSWITDANLTEAAVYVAVCHSIDVDWLNDRDQFLYPNDGWQKDFGFQSDCLVYTLFSNANCIKSVDGVNHWIPFTEDEVGAKDCFASHFMSDWLMGKRRVEDAAPYQGELFADTRDALPCKNLEFQDTQTPCSESKETFRSSRTLREAMSPTARAVLDVGCELWRYYHAQPNANPNASYYDIRLHFQGTTTDAKGKVKMNSDSSDTTYTTLLANLRAAMKNLAKRIEPKVYAYGFLKS